MTEPLTDTYLEEELRLVVQKERQALALLSDSIDGEWAKALRALYACKGKVVVSGIGKSGLVARKIAATLASTGTPSFFLHPAEALHGDVGMLGPDDLILALSKSGESDEVNAMLAAARRLGSGVIALTMNRGSGMARLADIVLDQGACEEACPLDLAPTCSTTAALAAGDALSMVLMLMRGFNATDFAKRHPGGRLGKRLLLTVADIMLAGDKNPVIRLNAGVRELLVVFTEKQAGAISVIDTDGHFTGLITDYDIRSCLQSGRNPLETTIAELMNPKPITVLDSEKAYTALCLMQDRQKPINVLPVVDNTARPVGMLRLQDLVQAGL
jgi:arabinose-5-phosphate isomerase